MYSIVIAMPCDEVVHCLLASNAALVEGSTMWLKLKPKLPRRCFISHSCADINERERLLQILPSDVEPVIFPPISVAPDEMISDRLVESILGCDGLIYLASGNSATSFWVAFERDYALRSRKEVFAFHPQARSLKRD